VSVRTLSLPAGGFFAAWAENPERFADFLPDPFAEDATARVAERVSGFARPREAVADALCAANVDERAVERLRDPESLVVVTGQQPGLLGGPLYSLAKAVSTVVAARELSGRTGKPVVPVFWVEGDDHDFEEVRTAWLLDSGGAPISVRYQPDDEAPGLPGALRRLDRNILALLDEFEAALPESEFKEEVMAAAREAYAPGNTLSEGFCRLLAWCTRGSGLIIMNPADPALKRLALPVFRLALDHQEEARRLIEETNARITAAGFEAQASSTGYGVFRTDDASVRRRIESPENISEHPERLSAAVLLRPLVQDFLLPTAVYVAGPSELAYHAQIGALYDLHRIPRPLVLPRHLVTVLGRANLRVLDQDGIPFDELAATDEAALNRRSGDPRSVEALKAAEAGMVERFAEVEAALGALDPSLQAAAARARGKSLGILRDLESKALRAAKRRDEERRKRFLRTRNALFPGGRPQERRLGPLVFFARYGPGFAGMMEEALGEPGADRLKRNLLTI